MHKPIYKYKEGLPILGASAQVVLTDDSLKPPGCVTQWVSTSRVISVRENGDFETENSIYWREIVE